MRRAARVLLALCAAAPVLCMTVRSWPVVVHIGSRQHVLNVPETKPVLIAVEEAGLLPGSDCRRGNCLSCAARVEAGAPFSLRVRDDTSLCNEAHERGFVLLCSAYVCGEGLEVRLDMEGEVWDLQYSQRFTGNLPPVRTGRKPHFRRGDVVEHLEVCHASDP